MHCAHDRDRWQALVNTVMNLQIKYKRVCQSVTTIYIYIYIHSCNRLMLPLFYIWCNGIQCDGILKATTFRFHNMGKFLDQLRTG
jgi:hypothetical protein